MTWSDDWSVITRIKKITYFQNSIKVVLSKQLSKGVEVTINSNQNDLNHSVFDLDFHLKKIFCSLVDNTYTQILSLWSLSCWKIHFFPIKHWNWSRTAGFKSHNWLTECSKLYERELEKLSRQNFDIFFDDTKESSSTIPLFPQIRMSRWLARFRLELFF